MVEDYQRTPRDRRITSYRIGEGPIKRIFTTLYKEWIQPNKFPRVMTLYPGDGSLKHRSKFPARRKELERTLGFAVAFGSIITSAFYFSTNITGFAIENLNKTDTNIVGTIFFVMGIAVLLFELRRK